jgi:hypothetical protein
MLDAGDRCEQRTEGRPARYRSKTPIVVLVFRDNHEAATILHANECIEVLGRAADHRFLIVRNQNREVLMFDSDVEDRCFPDPG